MSERIFYPLGKQYIFFFDSKNNNLNISQHAIKTETCINQNVHEQRNIKIILKNKFNQCNNIQLPPSSSSSLHFRFSNGKTGGSEKGHLLETKICIMNIKARQIPIIGWCGTKLHVQAQIVSASLAVVAHAAGDTWLNGYTITWGFEGGHNFKH